MSEEVVNEKSAEEKSTELVVRSFGAIVEHKSYGGKSLVENSQRRFSRKESPIHRTYMG